MITFKIEKFLRKVHLRFEVSCGISGLMDGDLALLRWGLGSNLNNERVFEVKMLNSNTYTCGLARKFDISFVWARKWTS